MNSKPTDNEKIYLSSPHMSDEGYEQSYIKEAFDANGISILLSIQNQCINFVSYDILNYMPINYYKRVS